MKPINARLTEYGNGNISVIAKGIMLAFWNKKKNYGVIAEQPVSTGYAMEIMALHYKTKAGWLKAINKRLNLKTI